MPTKTVPPTPTPDPPNPTWEPDPTPEGALPLRTEVEVNPNVVDRPGVPADLFDTYWWTEYGDAGQIGTTAQIGLPAGEQILDASDGIVVSARPQGGGSFDRVDLVVRDMRSGAIVRAVATSVGGVQAVLVGRRLIWAGMDPSSEFGGDRALDGGVWIANVDDTNEPIAVVKPGQDVSAWLSAGRGPLKVSPSGRTVTSGLGGYSKRVTDVIDVESATRRVRIRDIVVYAVTDEIAIVPDHPVGDYPQGGIEALEIDTQAMRWRYPSPSNVDRFELADLVANDGAFLLSHLWRGSPDEYRITRLDAVTGGRVVLVRDQLGRGGVARWAELSISSGRHIALVDDLGSVGHLLYDGPVSVDVLDAESGVVTEDAFVIDPPFLCYETYCLRNG